MLTPPLALIWSLDEIDNANTTAKIPSTNNTSGFNKWFLNNLLFHRWAMHTLSVSLSIVPPTQTRLQNESLPQLYEQYRSLVTILKNAAQQRGITVPQFPDVPTDWRDELAINVDKLRGELSLHAAEPVRKMLEYSSALVNSGEPFHWSSLVAVLSVGVDRYIDTVLTAGNSAGMGADETLVPYMDKMEDVKLLDCVGIMREEIMRIRSDAEETGWKEDEARRIVTDSRRLWAAFWTIGAD